MANATKRQQSTSSNTQNTYQQNYEVNNSVPVVSMPNVTTPIHGETSVASSTPICLNAFACGQQSNELKNDLEELKNRVKMLEETAVSKRVFLKKATSLLTVFRTVLIATPIALCASIATVQYFFYNDDKLLNVVTGIIGIVSVVECVMLPILWKTTAIIPVLLVTISRIRLYFTTD